MTYGPKIAEVAALVGDPGRANMLSALLDGRALTATELAGIAGITPATASGHLARLTEGGLLVPAAQGRHRYYRLATPDVARMLESIMVVAGGDPPPPDRAQVRAKARAVPRIPSALREARTCYDHLAGRLAVGVTDALVAQGAIVLSGDVGEVTEAGRTLFAELGVSLDRPARHRLLCRPCLDWSERRSHLAGVLGAALLERFEELHWIERGDTRAVTITRRGHAGFRDRFGLPND